MTNSEKVYRFLSSIAPKSASNSEIRARTGVSPHQQVFQITQSLMRIGKIIGRQRGREWGYWVDDPELTVVDPARSTPHPTEASKTHNIPSTYFERVARDVMSGHYG
jgi:hypothetical protein